MPGQTLSDLPIESFAIKIPENLRGGRPLLILTVGTCHWFCLFRGHQTTWSSLTHNKERRHGKSGSGTRYCECVELI
jgi:hypothetical protein